MHQRYFLAWLRSATMLEVDREWSIETWQELAGHSAKRVRNEALGRISREGDAGDLDHLLARRILTEPDKDLRIVAIEGLQRPTAREILKVLLQATMDVEPAVRGAVATILGGVPGNESRKKLEKMASSDPDRQVRRRAKRALRLQQKAEREQG